MSVRFKLVVIVLFAALVPLAVSAFMALRVHVRAFDDEVREQQRNAAHFVAALASELIDSAGDRAAAVARPIQWGELTAEELSGAVSLVYGQHAGFAAVQLLDELGKPRGAGVFLARASDDPALARHPVISLETFQAVSREAPREGAADAPVALSAVFAEAEGTRRIVAIGVPVTGPGGVRWTVAVGLSLAHLCKQVRGAPAGDLDVAVLDAQGRSICGDAPASLTEFRGDRLAVFESDGIERVGAVARMPNGWVVVAHQPGAKATAARKQIQRQTLYWIGLSVVIAIAAGLFLAQGIIGPVRRLAAGAEILAKGDLSHRIDVKGRDELADLAGTFNHMSAEIEAWNRELQDRVDARTAELKDAQQQLLQSQKIAAVSSLAAGVAHEINNPLTGVLGLTQVLKMQASKQDAATLQTLTTIETEAKRIRDIVQTLQSFSSEFTGEGYVELEVASIADGALALITTKIENKGVEVLRNYAAETPRVRGNDAQLRQAVLHVLDNAVAATAEGGRITVSTRSVEGGAAVLEVADTGRGIDPEKLARIFEPFFTTKQDWEGRGLGLTVAYRVFEDHGGSIEVDSEVRVGTTVTIRLPAAAGGAHLV